MTFEQLRSRRENEMRTMRRRKLYDGAKIDHPIYGTLTIRVSVEGFRAAGEGAEPAEHWEAINSEGRRVVPLSFTERGLHFLLKHGTFPRRRYAFK